VWSRGSFCSRYLYIFTYSLECRARAKKEQKDNSRVASAAKGRKVVAGEGSRRTHNKRDQRARARGRKESEFKVFYE
jgi:hypothetical protein